MRLTIPTTSRCAAPLAYWTASWRIVSQKLCMCQASEGNLAVRVAKEVSVQSDNKLLLMVDGGRTAELQVSQSNSMPDGPKFNPVSMSAEQFAAPQQLARSTENASERPWHREPWCPVGRQSQLLADDSQGLNFLECQEKSFGAKGHQQCPAICLDCLDDDSISYCS